MTSKGKPQSRAFSFRELTVWKTDLPDVKFGVLPPSNNRPNPLATQGTLYASVFAPGAICALDRDCGKLLWRTKLSKYANASVYLHDGRLFAGSPNTLLALRPDSGKTIWSFSPYGNHGESIYSSPAVHENRVYIGDRMGWLHCLDAADGKTIWKRQTNRTRNSDVNTTPVLMHGLAIVSTNARTAVAYDALSGKLAWKQQLDSPSIFGPLVHGGSVLAVSDSLYVLNPRTGRVRQRLSWGDRRVQQGDSTPQSIVLMFSPKVSSTKLPSVKAEAEKIAARESETRLMVFVAKSGMQRTKSVDGFCACFRYAPATGLVYLSHLNGVDVFRPTTGTLLCRVHLEDDTHGGVASVDVKEEKIYVLTGAGCVYALTHPTDL
jgi:outer membrane protein assembly factor BamB